MLGMLCSIKIQASIVVDNTGNALSLPVIVTREGVLKSYLNYLIVFRFRSQSWISRSVFSVRLLIDYVDVNKSVFSKPKDLFREFSNCLFTGTSDEDCYDPSGLFWRPRQVEDANSIIGYITHFTDWLAIENDDAGLQLNPYREASKFEQKLNWAAYLQRKNRSFLSHLWRNQDAKKSNSIVRVVQSKQRLSSLNAFSAVKAFPEGRINDLLYYGFTIPGKESYSVVHERLNLRNILITLLMHFGGLRISEVIQLYVEDIAHTSNATVKHVVKVHDPIYGSSPNNKNLTRREYLYQTFGIKPRCEYPSSSKQFAGWKAPLLTNSSSKFFTVEFFPTKAGDLFFEYWKLYLIHQRKSPESDAKHPYAFTSRTGSPYTIKAYSAARKRAVERIGLSYSKVDCTTAHADRHSYGQRLAENGVPPLVIKTAMHHRSLESQSTYTQPSEKELRQRLKEAEKRALKISNLGNLEASLHEES